MVVYVVAERKSFGSNSFVPQYPQEYLPRFSKVTGVTFRVCTISRSFIERLDSRRVLIRVFHDDNNHQRSRGNIIIVGVNERCESAWKMSSHGYVNRRA